MVMNRFLALLDPASALQTVESWASLPADARKRRAALASQNMDRSDLQSLLVAYVRLRGRRGTDTSPRTILTYWRGASKLLDWCETQATKPHQVEEADVLRFLASMEDLIAKSRTTYLSGARHLVGALRWAGLGAGDPFEHVRVIDPQRPEDTVNPYTPDELARLLEIANPRQRVILLLAAHGGLRVSEVSALRWKDIDWDQQRISVLGKGGRRAWISASRTLLAALRSIELEFGRPNVVEISARRIQAIVTRLCVRAGVPRRGYHALRHFSGTKLWNETHDLTLVARHLRHASTRTSEVYVHISPGLYEMAVSSFDTNGV